MTAPDYENHYDLLNLNFGADLRQVNAAWKRLSRMYHPDQYKRDSAIYKQALETQKQLNQAHDDLNTWFEKNPATTPPRSHKSNRKTGAKDAKEQEKTGWFIASKLELSPAQNLLSIFSKLCEPPGISTALAATILSFCLASIPAGMFLVLINTFFFWLEGHYAGWLFAWVITAECSMLLALFCRLFVEMELIHFQEYIWYFEINAQKNEAIDFIKNILQRRQLKGSICFFRSDDYIYETVLEEGKIVVRFAARNIEKNTIIALEARIISWQDPLICYRLLSSIFSEVKTKAVELPAAALAVKQAETPL